ncbi:MAG: ABC transporter permease subunit [Acidimicrobiia bacterium]|nr:ABC transporter permease subunit [Acidimicrobiia bacterium]
MAPLASHAITILFVLIVIVPVLYIIVLSTQTPSEFYQYPPDLSIGQAIAENYQTAWQRADMGRLLLNTSFVAVSVSIGKIILSITAAFAFVYFRFRGKNLLFIAILATHLLPLPVRIVPTFELMDRLGWINTFQSLTIPFFASATGMLLFRQFYQTIPTSLADAARVDGASPTQFLARILVPLSKTNMAALFLIEFIYMWNQYLWPLIVANVDATRMVQIGLKQLIATDAAIEWGVVMAGATMAMLPPLIVLLLLQKSLVHGLAIDIDK